MANRSVVNKSQSERFKEDHPECEAEQLNESDKDMTINAAEQEAVSCQVLTQDNAFSDRLESVHVHGSQVDSSFFVVLPEIKQTNFTMAETEAHSVNIKNKPQERRDLKGTIVQLHENLDEKENETRTTPSPELQISKKYPSFQNFSDEHSIYLDGEEMHQQLEEPMMDPKTRDDHPEKLSDRILEHVEDICIGREILLQATDEVESLEPPAKKKLRKRMGMCGLGDKKRKLISDGQHCRQGLLGIHRADEAPNCNKVVQNLYNTDLTDDENTLIDQGGMTGPECSENILALETIIAAVMDEGRTEEAEKESKYAIRTCAALMSDKVTTENSSKEHSDVLINSILDVNTGSISMGDKGTDEQIVSTGMVETPSSIMGGKNKLIHCEPSVAAASVDQDMEAAICGEEPNFTGIAIINIVQDIEFNPKFEALSVKQNHYAERKLGENLIEIATEIIVAKDANLSPIGAALENKSSVITPEEMISTVPTGLEAQMSEIEEQHPPSLAANEKYYPDRPELCRLSKKGCAYITDTRILEVASTHETLCAKDQGENDMFLIAVSDSAEPVVRAAEDTIKISEPLAPSSGQEDHIQCLLDKNTNDITVTPTVAEQQVCNPTLTSAPTELLQETDMSVSQWLYSFTDSQIHKIALSMEQEDQPVPESCDQSEDATQLVCGLIKELSSLNCTIMAAHREMELIRRGKLPTVPGRRLCGPRNIEK